MVARYHASDWYFSCSFSLRSAERDLTMPRDAVVTSENGGLLQNVSIGPHRFLADEPVGVGGWDAGPNPYELLLAALGACTAMTIRMYANRKHGCSKQFGSD